MPSAFSYKAVRPHVAVEVTAEMVADKSAETFRILLQPVDGGSRLAATIHTIGDLKTTEELRNALDEAIERYQAHTAAMKSPLKPKGGAGYIETRV